jgi:hypothetical protein
VPYSNWEWNIHQALYSIKIHIEIYRVKIHGLIRIVFSIELRYKFTYFPNKWQAKGRIKLSSFFEYLRDGTIDPLKEHKMPWQLVSLAAKSLHEYMPKMDRMYQQQQIAVATSLYSYPVMPVSIWRSIVQLVFMPKLHSLAQLIYAGGYKTIKSYIRPTNMLLTDKLNDGHVQQGVRRLQILPTITMRSMPC